MTSIITNSVHLTLRNRDTTFLKFIKSRSIGDLIKKLKVNNQQKFIDLSIDSTLEEVLDLLFTKNISSIPIYYLNEKQEKTYVSLISALGLLKLMFKKTSLDNLLENYNETLLIKLNSLIEFTEDLKILDSVDHLKTLLETLQETESVLVRHQSSYLVLNQFDLIQFFQDNNHHLGSAILDLSVKEIQSCPIQYRLPTASSSVEAFFKLSQETTPSVLPLVDKYGYVMDELKPSDLIGVYKNRQNNVLNQPILNYLKSAHRNHTRPPFTCHDRFTLSQVMTAFVLRKTDHLWWIDYQTDELKGVITLADILSTFSSFT